MLCEGELRQQATMGEWNTSIDTYLNILAEKTGALCAVACRLGVWSSLGKPAAVGRALTRYGMQLGLAFQLFDDWLDYWGTDQTGKTLGTDLRQGKPTLPLLRLLECSSLSQRNKLLATLEGDATHHCCNESVMQMLNESDASEFTLQMAVGCADSAVEELRGLPNSEARDCLEEIAKFSVSRVA
jgi:octaprenyl-diphosphate synthase